MIEESIIDADDLEDIFLLKEDIEASLKVWTSNHPEYTFSIEILFCKDLFKLHTIVYAKQ